VPIPEKGADRTFVASVPRDAVPGKPFVTRTPGGKEIQVLCPQGAKPGDQISVGIPEEEADELIGPKGAGLKKGFLASKHKPAPAKEPTAEELRQQREATSRVKSEAERRLEEARRELEEAQRELGDVTGDVTTTGDVTGDFSGEMDDLD